jgi:uncharacterized membrane protein YfcA
VNLETVQWVPIIVSLVITGMFSGTLAGLLGVGGGIINVPVLYFLFQYFGVSSGDAMLVATGTSLATIIPTSISSMRAHHHRGNVDWQLIKRWSFFIVGGVTLGAYLVTQLDGDYFAAVFALIALFMAFNLGFRNQSSAIFAQLPKMPWQGFLGTVIGFFSVMVGIGGGTLGVSILTAFNYAVHRAVGSSAVFGLLISLPGALILLAASTTPGDALPGTYGYVNIPSLIALVPLSVAFAPVGAWLGSKLDGNKLKKFFAVLLAITAIRMLVQVFSS